MGPLHDKVQFCPAKRIGMNVSAFILPFGLAACASAGSIPPAAHPHEDVRPPVVTDNLRGRWSILSVNGQAASGAWLELGAEGPPVAAQRPDGSFNIGAPRATTTAFLGCNSLQLNGWTRNGDKLALGIDGSMRTERGCDERIMAQEEQGYAILRLPVTMELTPPDRLRIVNENGTMDLIR